MQFLLLDSFERSISRDTENCEWHLPIWKKTSIECLESYCGKLLCQGSVLSPLLFIIVLETISPKFRVGRPWEMLSADDLVILAQPFVGLMTKMALWKMGQRD